MRDRLVEAAEMEEDKADASSMWETSTMERRYSVPPSTLSDPSGRYRTTEDLHAWSIYRQNLNSDITDSALGTSEKSQPPFGNFQLRESTVHTILNHPKYGPREHNSELGSNIFTYLRFGLPRVFPQSKPLRNGSSGYDSSDDGSPYMNGRRTRSDPDFRNSIIRPEDGGSAANPSSRRERRLKASSEANLLRSTDDFSCSESVLTRQQVMRAQQGAREGFQRNPMPGNGHVDRRGNESKAGSHISVNSRVSRGPLPPSESRADGFYLNDAPMLNERFFPKDTFYSSLPGADGETGLPNYPHLQVRDLSYEMDKSSAWHTLCGGARTKLRLLDGLSFEVRGGEILAVMATSEREGTALLDILANRHRKWRCRLRGDFIVNGLLMNPQKLEHCVAYVQRQPHFTPDMSVRQTLLFTSLLQEPDNNRGFDTKSRINALLEDLGLGQVKHTRVKDLTESEKQRLNVACQLLLDTDIVMLDQPTKGMDIFDTFFLVEYLRQWAARGRIVIMTIHPPTYEIFTMISRVALISTGRMLYFGKRRDMLPFFAYIDFPCPAYKNPSDYYMDLVTLDNLSAEAMLESSQRVENVVNIFSRRQEALSDPGPPAMPPATIKRANQFDQILALWIRVLIYMFPFNIVSFCQEIFLAALISICIGGIYWDVRARREQAYLWDRIGFYHVIMAIGLWPYIFNCITNVWQEKATITRDIRERLYGKFVYILCKLTYSLPSAAAVCIAYTLPAYSMAGVQRLSRAHSFGIYIGYMLLYLLTIRMLAMAFAWAFSSRYAAAAWTGFTFTFIATAAGYTVHFHNLSLILSWCQLASPMRWMMELLLKSEFSIEKGNSTIEENYSTENFQYNNNTIVQAITCGFANSSHAFHFFEYVEQSNLYLPLGAVVGFHMACFLLGLLFFLIVPQRQKKGRK